MYTAFIPVSFSRCKGKQKASIRLANRKAGFGSLPLNWSKIVWISSCVNEKQKLFPEHILPDIYAWLQPFEVDTAEIRLFCMNYAPQQNRETTRNMTHHTKASWKLKALALCIFWEASIPELAERPMVRGYLKQERCSHKAYSAYYFNNGTDSLICVLVALTHRLPSPRT